VIGRHQYAPVSPPFRSAMSMLVFYINHAGKNPDENQNSSLNMPGKNCAHSTAKADTAICPYGVFREMAG
jgi:hypothetical protein